MSNFKIGDRVTVNCKAHWAHEQQGEIVAFEGEALAKVKIGHFSLYVFPLSYLTPVPASADAAPTPARTLDSVTQDEARGLYVAAFGEPEFPVQVAYDECLTVTDGEHSLSVWADNEISASTTGNDGREIPALVNAAALTDALRALGVWAKPENNE